MIINEAPVISWFDKDTVRHLRFSFSFFLLPVFLFALSQAQDVHWENTVIAFFVLHFFIFPASNGYNSYQDHDESSIGGLKNPPKVTDNLFFATLMFDIAGILAGLLISVYFSFFILVFIVMSRMYSYRGIRLKKYPVTGFLTVFIFQGAFIYMISFLAVSSVPLHLFFTVDNIICMAIASLFIGGMFPITQIYQHEADRKDGVTSISFKLGYRGTFIFSGILFFIGSLLLLYYLYKNGQLASFPLFLVFLFPVAYHLSRWFVKVKKNRNYANFENTMKANLLASSGMNIFFVLLIFNNHIPFQL